MSQEINLLGTQLRHSRRSATSAVVLGPVLLILAAIGIGAGLFFKQEARNLGARHASGDAAVQRAQDEQRKLAQEVANVKKDPALEAELAGLEKRLLAVQLDLAALSTGAIGQTQGFSDFMRALAHQGVDGVWLTGFNVGAAGKDISISGRALRAELVPAYLKRLGQDPYFSGRTFAALDLAQPKAGDPSAEGVRANTVLAFNLTSRRDLSEASGERPPAGSGVPR
jgi:hypothetical protein